MRHDQSKSITALYNGAMHAADASLEGASSIWGQARLKYGDDQPRIKHMYVRSVPYIFSRTCWPSLERGPASTRAIVSQTPGKDGEIGGISARTAESS